MHEEHFKTIEFRILNAQVKKLENLITRVKTINQHPSYISAGTTSRQWSKIKDRLLENICLTNSQHENGRGVEKWSFQSQDATGTSKGKYSSVYNEH